ncbi:hypothetical protein [Bradyrhizobium sp. Ec3.3]|uniref:hypothetical protein n=1 Tax=Bradyrhizobium sp. Ec3.3 TaxID=189753 RepID=UPI00041498D5|nr:hypothetical protein [Bradyrhizobium sp. Ec3.3]
MTDYKRNQVAEAISRVFDEQSAEPSPALRTRIKRLLDTDRGQGRNLRSSDPEISNYAFYSDDSGGKGADVLFSDYEAFALMLGLQMLNHNWPQLFAVKMLRQYRKELEARHARILRVDPKVLFDPEQMKREARPGAPAYPSTSRVFLLICSDNRYAKDPEAVAALAKIFDDETTAVAFTREKAGRSTTWLELGGSAHLLANALSRTQPKQRGRS